MNYIVEFSVFKKDGKNWKEKFQYIYDRYLELKVKDEIDILDKPDSNIKENSFSISIGTSPHLYFYKKDNVFIVTDFDEVDLESLDYPPNAIQSSKSNKGDYIITKDEYEKYLKLTKEIDDWLDNLSEEEFGKSDIKIDDSGEFELNEFDLKIDDLNHQLKKEVFGKFIGKKFEFEIRYHLWESNSKNQKIVERREFLIDDITIDFSNRFYIQVWSKDIFNKICSFWIESDTNYSYYDLDVKFPEYEKIISIDIKKEEKTRKEERESVYKYPHVISYDSSPSKYNSIEFIKELTELLTLMNAQVKSDKN